MSFIQPRLFPWMLALVAVALVWPPTVQAQVAPKKDATFVVRVYEVTDLVVHAPDYDYSHASQKTPGRGQGAGLMGDPFGGGMGGMGGSGMGGMGMGGMGGGMAPSPHRTVAPPGIGVMELLETIINVCSADSWTEEGGKGAVEPLGYSLVVSQTEDVHKEIQDLLDQLRKGSGKRRTVAIDVRWLLLDSDELDKLTPTDQQGSARVDRDSLAEYTRRPSSIRAITSCFSGQQVYVVSGTRQSVVTSVIPVVGSIGKPEDFGAQLAAGGTADEHFMFVSQVGTLEGGESGATATPRRNVGYQPVVEKPNFGALLEIRPTLVPDDNSAIVDLRSTITASGKPTGNLAAQPPQAGDAPQVDRIAIETQELATTLNIPLGEPVLVGGMTYVASSALAPASAGEAASPPDESANKETPQLYLILELKVGPSKGPAAKLPAPGSGGE